MIKLTTTNTKNAVQRARQLRPKVIFISDRVFEVKSSNNENSYTVRFDVRNGDKLAQCECRASEKARICYHIAAAAQVNIIRQSVKRQYT